MTIDELFEGAGKYDALMARAVGERGEIRNTGDPMTDAIIAHMFEAWGRRPEVWEVIRWLEDLQQRLHMIRKGIGESEERYEQAKDPTHRG